MGGRRPNVSKTPPGPREANPGPRFSIVAAWAGTFLFFLLLFFVAVSRPEQTNCAKANLGTPAPIVTLSPTHSHTFPLSTQHPILSKDEERAEPRAPALRPPAQIKTANLPSFLSLSLDMFRDAAAAPLCRLCCLVFKQAGDYNNDNDDDDDDDDGNDDRDGGGGGGGSRRSSCRGLRDGRTIGLFA